MNRHKILNLIYCVMLLLCVSCKDFSKVKDPHCLYLHLPMEPGSLNPIITNDAYSGAVFGQIYESLIETDLDTLKYKPRLAESWETLDNGLRFRFHLKKNVRFSDGVEMTADDVLYSYRLIMDPKVPSAHIKVYYMDIKEVKKIDKYTIDFTWKKPYFLSLSFSGGITVIPKHIFGNGQDFISHPNNRNPIGTGPFVFDKWDTGRKIVLKENKLYHGKPLDIKEIVYRFISEENIALQMLKKGEIDYMQLREIQWVRQTNSDKFQDQYYKLKYYLPFYRYIGWNLQKNLFADKKVRLALTHFINRQGIVDKMLFGLGDVVTGPFYINSDAYDKTIKPWPYDPEQGKRILAQAGWHDSDNDGILEKNGQKFIFTMTIPSGRETIEKIATIIKEDLSKAGIVMEINRYEWAVFLNKINSREFDTVILGWSFGFENDPYQVWHSTQVTGGSNFIGYNNKEADALILSARTELNVDRRNAIYRRFHRLLHEEQPYTFLFTTYDLKVLSKRFENVIVHKAGLNLEEWKVRDR